MLDEFGRRRAYRGSVPIAVQIASSSQFSVVPVVSGGSRLGSESATEPASSFSDALTQASHEGNLPRVSAASGEAKGSKGSPASTASTEKKAGSTEKKADAAEKPGTQTGSVAVMAEVKAPGSLLTGVAGQMAGLPVSADTGLSPQANETEQAQTAGGFGSTVAGQWGSARAGWGGSSEAAGASLLGAGNGTSAGTVAASGASTASTSAADSGLAPAPVQANATTTLPGVSTGALPAGMAGDVPAAVLPAIGDRRSSPTPGDSEKAQVRPGIPVSGVTGKADAAPAAGQEVTQAPRLAQPATETPGERVLDRSGRLASSEGSLSAAAPVGTPSPAGQAAGGDSEGLKQQPVMVAADGTGSSGNAAGKMQVASHVAAASAAQAGLQVAESGGQQAAKPAAQQVAGPVQLQAAVPVTVPVAQQVEPQQQVAQQVAQQVGQQVAQQVGQQVAVSMTAAAVPALTSAGGAGLLSSKGTKQAAAGLRTLPASFGQAGLTTTSTLQAQDGLGQRPVTALNAAAAVARPGEHATSAGRDGHKVDAEGGASTSSTDASSSTNSTNPAGAANSANPGNAVQVTGAGQAANSSQAVLVQPAPPSIDAGQRASGSSRQEGPAAAADSLPTGGEVSGASAEGQALPSINTARVIESMQGSEMRVGMHSVEFGNVSVSTMLNHQSIAAQISFEHMDLGKALSVHVPSIEARLSSEYGMQARVEIRDQSLSAGADSGQGQDRQAGGRGTSTASTALTASGAGVVDSGGEPGALTGFLNGGTRLDIRA